MFNVGDTVEFIDNQGSLATSIAGLVFNHNIPRELIIDGDTDRFGETYLKDKAEVVYSKDNNVGVKWFSDSTMHYMCLGFNPKNIRIVYSEGGLPPRPKLYE